MECESLPGWALCRIGGTLSSAPLTTTERTALPKADLWLVRGARITAFHLADGESIDPSTWIDLDGYPLHDTFELAWITPSFNLPHEIKHSLRDVMGAAVPIPSEERSRFFAQAAKHRPRENVLGQAVSMAGFVARSLMERLRFSSASEVGSYQSHPDKSSVPPRAERARTPQNWRQWAARLALLTQVSRWIGWRQAAYLRKMLALFDDRDLREALRHAIPLGDGSDSLGQAFGSPGPRSDLSLSTGRQQRAGIAFGEQLDNHLRALYRQAFQRLDREGRIDEAVFVLAELLEARQEALDYLVQHDRTTQAAELALSWDFPPETIVRLLCLSGDWDRAMLVARRDNAFSAAVLMLQKQRPELADRLRMNWGDALVAKGEWLAAVEAVWPVKSARERAAEWLRLAEASGGSLGARSLVQRAVLLPDTMECHADRIVALRDGVEQDSARADLAMALLSIKETGVATAALATAIFPRLLADRLVGRNRMTNVQMAILLKQTGDPFWRADLPALELPEVPRPTPLAQVGSTICWRAPSPGLQSISDVALLSDHRYAIAQGEAGVAIFNSYAKELRRYGVPADRLVIADSGRVALAMAKRDSVWRITRIDLVSDQVTDLGVLPLDHFADSFDGIGWTVVSDGRLLVLDTTRTVRDVMWHVSDLPGLVTLLNRGEKNENVVVQTSEGFELWRYELPGRRLKQRDPLPSQEEDEGITLMQHSGIPFRVSLRTVSGDEGEFLGISWKWAREVVSVTVPMPDFQNGIVARMEDAWLIAGLDYSAHFSWFLLNLDRRKIGVEVIWPSPRTPRMRITGSEILFFDEGGRILHISTADASVKEIVLV
jgi:hypothetical protein